MFPLTHKFVADYCLTHTAEECSKLVADMLIKNLLIVLSVSFVGSVVWIIYKLVNKYYKKKK